MLVYKGSQRLESGRELVCLSLVCATYRRACAWVWFLVSPPKELRFEERRLRVSLKLLALELHLFSLFLVKIYKTGAKSHQNPKDLNYISSWEWDLELEESNAKLWDAWKSACTWVWFLAFPTNELKFEEGILRGSLKHTLLALELYLGNQTLKWRRVMRSFKMLSKGWDLSHQIFKDS